MGKARFLIMNGKVVPYEEARVHVLSTAMKYAASVYEGLRAYWSGRANQLYVFRMEDHLRRLRNSAEIARLPLPLPAEEFAGPILEVIRANGFREDLHIRLIVFVEADDGALHSCEPVGYAAAAIPCGRYFGTTPGLRVAVSSWTRTADNAIPPRVKAAANYQNSRLALVQARLDGYDDAILLNANGTVAEGPGYTVFLVRDGHPATPTLAGNILEGVTRSTLITLFEETLGLAVQARDIQRTELYIAEEAFFCGSAAEVTPIISIDHHPIGKGTMGPVTAKIREAYFQVVREPEAVHPEWRTPVYR